MWVLLFPLVPIVLIILIVLLLSRRKKAKALARTAALEAALADAGMAGGTRLFSADPGSVLALDEAGSRICLAEHVPFRNHRDSVPGGGPVLVTMIRPEELYEVRVREDRKTILEAKTTRAVEIKDPEETRFWGTKAAAGKVRQISLQLALENPELPNVVIDLMPGAYANGLPKSHPIYQGASQTAAQWYARLSRLIV